MGLKEGAEVQKHDSLVGRAGLSVQRKVEEKGGKTSVLLGRGTVGDNRREDRVKRE